MDVDIVVKVTRREARAKLVSALRNAGLHVDEKSIDAAFESGFRIVKFRDSASPFSVDIILSSRKFEKRAGTLLGLPTFYQAPEDLILAKLRMIKATVPRERALKDEDDVRGVLRFTEVDMKRLRRRAHRDSTLLILEEITLT
jgi:hypothetical protein